MRESEESRKEVAVPGEESSSLTPEKDEEPQWPEDVIPTGNPFYGQEECFGFYY